MKLIEILKINFSILFLIIIIIIGYFFILDNRKNDYPYVEQWESYSDEDSNLDAVIIFDFQCEYCADYHNRIDSLQYSTRYNISWVPVDFLGDRSNITGRFYFCSSSRGTFLKNFFRNHNQLLQLEDSIYFESLIDIEPGINLDCVANDSSNAFMEKNYMKSKNLDVELVPTSIIYGYMYNGALSNRSLETF
ncbi:MAG: hypothetical protein JJ892_14955 [Balneola sp.]|nr:hypothetical protein [Balneola sp.]